jgi:hypothetical protein
LPRKSQNLFEKNRAVFVEAGHATHARAEIFPLTSAVEQAAPTRRADIVERTRAKTLHVADLAASGQSHPASNGAACVAAERFLATGSAGMRDLRLLCAGLSRERVAATRTLVYGLSDVPETVSGFASHEVALRNDGG